MKNKNNRSIISLAVKLMGGVAFLFVFMLNISIFNEEGKATGEIQLDMLKAYADTGGEATNCGTGQSPGEIVTESISDPYEKTMNNTTWICKDHEGKFVCSVTGTVCGVCNNPMSWTVCQPPA